MNPEEGVTADVDEREFSDLNGQYPGTHSSASLLPARFTEDDHARVSGYSQRYTYGLVWIAILFAGYANNRLFALTGFPPDVQTHTWLGHARNLVDLTLLGFLQGWFADLTDSPVRWKFIVNQRWFLPLFFGTSMFFCVISSIPGLDHAITEDTEYSVAFSIVVLLCALLVLFSIVWHIIFAFSSLSQRDWAAYMFARVLTLSFLAFAYFLIRDEPTMNGPAKLHLHHYFIAWLVSLTASFNHPISVGVLAIAAGIFVQGVSIYSAGTMFYRGPSDSRCPEVFIHAS